MSEKVDTFFRMSELGPSWPQSLFILFIFVFIHWINSRPTSNLSCRCHKSPLTIVQMTEIGQLTTSNVRNLATHKFECQKSCMSNDIPLSDVRNFLSPKFKCQKSGHPQVRMSEKLLLKWHVTRMSEISSLRSSNVRNLATLKFECQKCVSCCSWTWDDSTYPTQHANDSFIC